MNRIVGNKAVAVLIAAITTLGFCSDASAAHHKTRSHHRAAFAQARHGSEAANVQLVLQQPSRQGAMRYYGGPKSPMWRGPVEN